ncbi:MAG TPA: hypothetical protein VLR69_19410, partial [Thermoanaerobaculia bacterium]|nr:hypothetical protein [Thermoanaerobaculia bacterium]
KRKKKGAPGENGNGAHEPAPEGERPRGEASLAPVLEGPEFVEAPAGSFDDEEDEDEEGEEDFEEGAEGAEAAGAEGEPDKPGAGGVKRRRRRRRRRK